MASKKSGIDYSNPDLLLGRKVSLMLSSGVTLVGEVRACDLGSLVLVNEPTSALDIENKITHTLVQLEKVEYISFQTDKG